MAKRFTDTGKWKKEFIKGLPAKMKLLWFYILDDCDHAGIWEVDLEVASIRIGEKITYEEAFAALGEKISLIGKNKWFIRDFIFFQYGELSEKNRMHQSVISILKKYNIPLVSPFQGAKDMDKEQDKDKDKDKEPAKKEIGNVPEEHLIPLPFNSHAFTFAWNEWNDYRRERKKKLTPSTAKKQLAKLAKFPEQIAIEIINNAIERGWEGLYEVDQKVNRIQHDRTNGKGSAQAAGSGVVTGGKAFGNLRRN